MRKPRTKTVKQVAAERNVSQARVPTDAQSPKEEVQGVPLVPRETESAPRVASSAASVAVVESPDIELVEDNGWSDADLSFLKPTVAPAPTLPMDKLPPALSKLVVDFVEARNVVPDFTAFAILGAVSGAIGNRVRVGLPDGTTEMLNTYTVLVGEPSTGKGRALNVVEGPLRVLDDELSGAAGAVAATMGQAALARVLEQIQAKVSRRLAVDYEKLVPADVGESAAASLLVTEATGPGLLDELAIDQNGRMLLSHEIAGALGYLMSSQASRSQAILLTAFDGGPYTGRSKTGGRVRIPALVLSILGATQPRKLPALLRGADDGFAARVFWIYPDTMPTAAFGIDPGPVELLQGILSRLTSIKSPGTGANYSAVIPLGAAARELVEGASTIWLRQQDLSSELFATVLGRGRQYAIRLGGLLELVAHVMAGKHGLPATIGPEAVASAVALVDGYLLPMAERTFTTIRPKDTNAVALAKYLARGSKGEINAREDIVRGHGSPVREASEVREVLEELRQRGLVRPAPQGGGRGRPSGDWHVHPALLALGKA